MLKKFFFFLTGLCGIFLCVGAFLVYWFIAVQPGEEIRQENLRKVLAVESPVYYRDGINKIGVFFQNDHRQYIPYELIPRSFVNAIVASEDRNFFQHHGVDFLGIARAMTANFKAGRVVQGGSTLTQQAAKNLFKRKNRSLEAKLLELLYAWRLEYHYSKEKILEFYANQFYVSGNGRGLGVAAQYYFDKPASELTILESAFIAGSVKRPNYYNPFIKKDEESARAARRHSKERTRYVLQQMHKLGSITTEQLQDSLNKEIPFRKGQMSYALNTIMDMVKDALVEPEVEEAFVSHGIENVATSGIKIFTTVEKRLQEFSFTSLRKELSRLSVRLEGYDHEELQKLYRDLKVKRQPVELGAFVFGSIQEVVPGEKPAVKVFLGETIRNGKREERTGIIDKEGLMQVVYSLVKYNGQRWTEVKANNLADFMMGLKEGDLVYVSVRDIDADSNFVLDLEKYPGLQGALIALDKGQIRGMVGGSENRFFNRAVDARRLMGSVSKPLVYTAAIQLGWNSADFLKNARDVFQYQRQLYFPRPDHVSPYTWVSMSWAGVKSENVASVWLLYHLCDRLAPAQFKALISRLGLARDKGESYRQYSSRLRDKYGIIVDSMALRQVAFERALKMIEPDLVFAGKIEESELLGIFHYELDTVIEEEDTTDEADIRREILRRNFVRMQKFYRDLQRYKVLVEFDANGVERWPQPVNDSEDQLEKFIYTYNGRYAFSEESPGPGWERLTKEQVRLLWQTAAEKGAGFWGEILLDNLLSADTVKQMVGLINKEYRQLKTLPPYGIDLLSQFRDFKVRVGIEYVIGLAREMGVRSNLDPVLSFPLGSNVITPLEVARMYETMITGERYLLGREGAGEGLTIIDRIERGNGEVVYKPQLQKKQVVDPKTSLQIADILRKVVIYGTARYADQNIKLKSHDPERMEVLRELDLHVPVLGKTGTANMFRNSAFAGFVPGLMESKDVLGLSEGYSLAVYEGFDDNKTMVRTSSHITGSSGALRLWTDVAKFIIDDHGYADKVDLDDLSFSLDSELPLLYPELGQVVVSQDVISTIGEVDDAVVPQQSLASDRVQLGPNVVSFGEIDQRQLKPARHFKPYWGEH